MKEQSVFSSHSRGHFSRNCAKLTVQSSSIEYNAKGVYNKTQVKSTFLYFLIFNPFPFFPSFFFFLLALALASPAIVADEGVAGESSISDRFLFSADEGADFDRAVEGDGFG